jgi:glutamate-5-semialdehyde dehydrogenase
MSTLIRMAKRAKEASAALAQMPPAKKNDALEAAAVSLVARQDEIIAENQLDIAAAREIAMPESKIDRLMLDEGRIAGIAAGLRQLVQLPDPVGRVLKEWTVPTGLRFTQVTVPMGVIGVIYESRPNVTADAAGICLKSGSAAVLRGGKEAIHSNLKIAEVMRDAYRSVGCDPEVLQIVEDTSRRSASKMMTLNDYIDVLIPRGGQSLIRSVVQNATVLVIETGTGNCHIYVDKSADLAMAQRILYNAKTQRVSVCNAAETLLVHADVAGKFLPAAAQELREAGVELRGCRRSRSIVRDMGRATRTDYATEFLDYILAVCVVDSLDAAIEHISHYGSGHSETVVAEDVDTAEAFLRRVDAAAVYHNASTRFTDGGEFGFGAEIGISTQKLHARGPMGLEQLCSYKYIVHGSGQIR